MFRGTVNHTRFLPLKHNFKYKVTYFWFDIKNKNKSIFFKKNGLSLFSFFEKDHGPKKKEKKLFRLISNQLYSISIKNIKYIKILCLPRILGYVFNPISIFVCYDSKKIPKAIIFEVCNTFNDRHAYVCPIQKKNNVFKMKKKLYVSPFFNVEGLYKINFSIEREFVNLFIVYEIKKKKVFEASFKGKYIAMSELRILKVFFSSISQNVKVTLGIYYEALKLFLKGASYINRPKKNKNFFSMISKDG